MKRSAADWTGSSLTWLVCQAGLHVSRPVTRLAASRMETCGNYLAFGSCKRRFGRCGKTPVLNTDYLKTAAKQRNRSKHVSAKQMLLSSCLSRVKASSWLTLRLRLHGFKKTMHLSDTAYTASNKPELAFRNCSAKLGRGSSGGGSAASIGSRTGSTR